MRWIQVRLVLVAAMALAAVAAEAHHPDFENQPVRPRVDVIGPIGNRLPSSYRRKYNRPTNFGGWLAYHVAPSSQEAMAWHDATHRDAYKCDRPRLEMHYFYPKPYEALRIGPRRDSRNIADAARQSRENRDESMANRDAMKPADVKPTVDLEQAFAETDELAPVNVDEAVEQVMERTQELDAKTLLDSGFDE
ncbi:hypothetical protein [Rubripirellula tenax]|nr:hypothetical protein [Rubripirellula tenax]